MSTQGALVGVGLERSHRVEVHGLAARQRIVGMVGVTHVKHVGDVGLSFRVSQMSLALLSCWRRCTPRVFRLRNMSHYEGAKVQPSPVPNA